MQLDLIEPFKLTKVKTRVNQSRITDVLLEFCI